MALTYSDIFALVNTIDNCTVLENEGSCQVEILSDSGHTLCFSRQLYCGELRVTIDDGCIGTCEYIAHRKNLTGDTQTIPATRFRTDNEQIDRSDSKLRSTIGEIVKIDVANVRKFAVACC
jgi:hypothetical protein